MPRQRYSGKEAINRIVRSWLGKTLSEAPETLDGEVLSENQAWSDLAEAFEESLTGETLVAPPGLATWINANVGANIEYGEIYNNSTGTAVVSLSTSWAKVTGSFQGNTVSSTNITPDYLNDRITVNHQGILFVGMQLSFSGGANATVEAAVYWNGVRQESLRFRRRLGSGGDVGSASALGLIQVTGTAADLEIYARTDSGTPNFKVESGQLWLYGLPLN